MNKLYVYDIDSSIGRLTLWSNGTALIGLAFPGEHEAPVQARGLAAERARGPFTAVIAELEAWFAGRRREFTVPLTPQGTPFQLRVWEALRAIPFGTTISYGELAKRIGQPKAMRAVGGANRRNPIPLIVPCHR